MAATIQTISRDDFNTFFYGPHPRPILDPIDVSKYVNNTIIRNVKTFHGHLDTKDFINKIKTVYYMHQVFDFIDQTTKRKLGIIETVGYEWSFLAELTNGVFCFFHASCTPRGFESADFMDYHEIKLIVSPNLQDLLEYGIPAGHSKVMSLKIEKLSS
jgi:hypothetical protein